VAVGLWQPTHTNAPTAPPAPPPSPPVRLRDLFLAVAGVDTDQPVHDILIRFSDLADYPAVILNAGSYSLYYDTPSPPIGSWESRAIPLTEAGWKRSNTNAAATEAEFRGALAELAKLLPDTAVRIVPDGSGRQSEEVPLTLLRDGDLILIRPGARIPADGVEPVQSALSDLSDTRQSISDDTGCDGS